MKITEIDQFLTELEEVGFSDQLVENYRAYYLQEAKLEQIFALVKLNSQPLLIDFLTDANLSRTLRDRYESVVPSKLMDERTWLRVIDSGQLAADQILDCLRLAYQLKKAAAE